MISAIFFVFTFLILIPVTPLGFLLPIGWGGRAIKAGTTGAVKALSKFGVFGKTAQGTTRGIKKLW